MKWYERMVTDFWMALGDDISHTRDLQDKTAGMLSAIFGSEFLPPRRGTPKPPHFRFGEGNRDSVLMNMNGYELTGTKFPVSIGDMAPGKIGEVIDQLNEACGRELFFLARRGDDYLLVIRPDYLHRAVDDVWPEREERLRVLIEAGIYRNDQENPSLRKKERAAAYLIFRYLPEFEEVMIKEGCDVESIAGITESFVEWVREKEKSFVPLKEMGESVLRENSEYMEVIFRRVVHGDIEATPSRDDRSLTLLLSIEDTRAQPFRNWLDAVSQSSDLLYEDVDRGHKGKNRFILHFPSSGNPRTMAAILMAMKDNARLLGSLRASGAGEIVIDPDRLEEMQRRHEDGPPEKPGRGGESPLFPER